MVTPWMVTENIKRILAFQKDVLILTTGCIANHITHGRKKWDNPESNYDVFEMPHNGIKQYFT